MNESWESVGAEGVDARECYGCVYRSYHPSMCDRGLPNDRGEKPSGLFHARWTALTFYGLLRIVREPRAHNH